jgi:hypothetical protein
MEITTMWAFPFERFSITQSPFHHAVEIPKHMLQRYLMLMVRVIIVLAENSDGTCDIRGNWWSS